MKYFRDCIALHVRKLTKARQFHIASLVFGFAFFLTPCALASEHAQITEKPELSLLLEINIAQDMKLRLAADAAEICRALHDAHIDCTMPLAVSDSIGVMIADSAQTGLALDKVKTIDLARGYDAPFLDHDAIILQLTDAHKLQLIEQVTAQYIAALRKKLEAAGIKKFSVNLQGDDCISIQETDLQNPGELLDALKINQRLAFRLVDETIDPTKLVMNDVPITDELIEQASADGNTTLPKLLVERRELVTGDHLTNIGWSTNLQYGFDAMTFRFDAAGKKQFADATREYVGRRFAIVFDGKVISAPFIREPVLGGEGEIEGPTLTLKYVHDLAAQLRNVALHAPYRIIAIQKAAFDTTTK